MRHLALAVAMLLASLPARSQEAQPAEAAPAPAAEPAPAAAPTPAAEPAAHRAKGTSRFGLAMDAGVPEGASVALAYRPNSTLRFWVGPAWNYVAFGAQGGVAVVPWRFIVTPVFSAEAGRFFAADVSFLAKDRGGVPEGVRPLLENMSYWYGSAHVGIELGGQNSLALSILAGVSYVSLQANGTATMTDSTSGAIVRFTDPRLRGTLPSVKVGLHFWF